MSALAERPSALPQTEPRSAAETRPWNSVTIADDIAAIEDDWRALEAHALVTPYQAYGWVRAFVETVGAAHDMAFRYALLRDAGGGLVALLPLVITTRSGIRFAEFIGGKHANYHMGLYAPAFAASLDASATRRMLQEVAAAIGSLDGFVFVNQPRTWQGVTNPPAQLATGPSPSGAYKLALIPGDGEATLRRTMSSHAQKKLKNKRNRFATFGPSELLRAEGQAGIARAIEAFLAQKAARFRAMGVADPFAEPAMRTFLQKAAHGDGRHAPALELYTLELSGRPIATYVGAVQGARFSGMATSFDMESETAKTSPGEILLIDLIKRKCREGIEVLDLGVGEARYKTTICDEHDELVDSFLALTLKGRGFVALARAKRALKRRVKASPAALRMAQRVSGWLGRDAGRSAGEG